MAKYLTTFSWLRESVNITIHCHPIEVSRFVFSMGPVELFGVRQILLIAADRGRSVSTALAYFRISYCITAPLGYALWPCQVYEIQVPVTQAIQPYSLRFPHLPPGSSPLSIPIPAARGYSHCLYTGWYTSPRSSVSFLFLQVMNPVEWTDSARSD